MDTSTDPRPAGTSTETLAKAENDLPGTGRRTARDRTVDTVLSLFALALWGIELVLVYLMGANYATVQPTQYYVFDAIVGLVACLSLRWRRSHPMSVMWAVGLAAAVAVSAMGALFVGLAGAAIYRPWRVWIVPFVILSALVLPWVLWNVPGTGMQIVTLAAAIGFMLACVGWGTAVRSRRMLVQRLREDVARARQDRERHLDDARSEERRRIAREMHDVVAHRMSLLSVHAGALAYRTERAREGKSAPLEAEELATAVAVVRDNAHQALDELGGVLEVLRSGDLVTDEEHTGTARPQPGAADIDTLVEEAVATGQRVAFERELPEDDQLGESVGRTVYRVVQEGLTNARKHAPGSSVHVELSGDPERGVEVAVVNGLPPGIAPAEIPGLGAGLAGLAERVALEGGRITHGAVDGRFHLTAVLPWEHGRRTEPAKVAHAAQEERR
ncbi:two-component sensor histidine kinase [Nocardiopsis kunsanensis]|uniref:histidine kinase n=1 Tax=Nocardiopsis kunsanensis TaxID=141693 RepID=A0A919CK44_9ACTN|nr:histidine kinase [Nocardiopsis kunsanensis]GHD29999.1 two-component sensor histidine kinase [Nocardiopsis kunsanensis]